MLCMAFAKGQYEKDVTSVDAIIAALYDVISGPGDEERDWNRLRYLCHADAKLIPCFEKQDGSGGVRYLGVEDYIKAAAPAMAESGFFERETGRKTEQYSNIVHCFSTYESRYKAGDAKPFERGINSIQLMYDGTRWWVLNILWQGETDKFPLPKKYLKKK